jgi:hypothetical protein
MSQCVIHCRNVGAASRRINGLRITPNDSPHNTGGDFTQVNFGLKRPNNLGAQGIFLCPSTLKTSGVLIHMETKVIYNA